MGSQEAGELEQRPVGTVGEGDMGEDSWLLGRVTLTGRGLLATAVASLGSQVLVIQEGGGEHEGEQVEEVVVPRDDNQDLQQDLQEGLSSELHTAAPVWALQSLPPTPRSLLRHPARSAASLASVLSPLLTPTMAPQHHLEKTHAQHTSCPCRPEPDILQRGRALSHGHTFLPRANLALCPRDLLTAGGSYPVPSRTPWMVPRAHSRLCPDGGRPPHLGIEGSQA